MFSLHLYQRLADGNGFERDLTQWARYNWRRSTRAIGGYWTGDFSISGPAAWQLQALYDTMIGKRICEWSYGRVTWEGEVVELSLTLNGETNTISQDAEIWHNRVKCEYTYPRVDDEEQGVLAYVSPAGNDGFQDTLQDFSDWETAAPGTAVYEIEVLNDDDSVSRGYCGDAFATGGANDSIYVYEDLELTQRGWSMDNSGGTPISYEISNILLAGTRQVTAWAEQVGSTDIYGDSEYIDVLADECYAGAAESARDRRLSAHAYPRSLPTGGLASGEARSGENRLDVACAGYVFGMNRRFYETNVAPDDISTQISTLVTASEFVTANSILENTDHQVPLTGEDTATLIWDCVEGLIAMGDSSDNRYVGGVRAGRLFDYDLAATTVLYQWKNGRLEYLTGQPVRPTLIRPDILVRLGSPVSAPTFAPDASAWTRQGIAYIGEVEFQAPRGYRLIPDQGDILVGSY